MLTFGIVLVGAVMIAHGWWQANVTEGKSTGWIAGPAGVALAAAVVAPAAVFGRADVSEGTLLLLWAIYALAVAAAGIWDTGTRALGFYAAYLTVASVVFLISFVTQGSTAGVVVSAVQAIAFFLLFLQMAPPLRSLNRIVAWIFIVAGAVVSLVGFGDLLGLLG